MAADVPDDVDTYRRHATELIRYATVLVGPDDAPDVVTDAVLAAFNSARWALVKNRRAYLYRAVLNRGLSHRRSDTRRRRRETVVDTEGGTGSSPVQVLLFHEGTYIGTATECALPFTTVTGTSTDSVTIEYRWPRGDDPNATPSGLATVTYRWAGDAVQTDGELPQELLDITGCTG
jgi:hypothetical protein